MPSIRSAERWFHSLALARPRTVTGVALVLALIGAWGYFFELPVVSSRGALTDESREFNRRARAYDREFGRNDDPLVLVLRAGKEGEAERPNPRQREAMKGVASRWASMLERRPDLFSAVRARVPPSELEPYTLLYLPPDVFDRAVEALDAGLPVAESLLAARTITGSLEEVVELVDTISPPGSGAPRGDPDAEAGTEGAALGAGLEALEHGLRWLRREVAPESVSRREAPGEGESASNEAPRGEADPLDELLASLGGESLDPEGYLFTSDGRLLTAVAFVRSDPTARQRFAEPLEYARAALDTALADVEEGVVLDGGLAGEPPLEQEEMTTAQRDFGRASLLALLAVSVIFMWAFGTVLRPVLAAVVLGMSIATTFLFTWLVIGHLNAIAMVFAVILIALGVDFAIHFYTHYRRGLADELGPEGAVRRTYRHIGGALWMNGIATAGAFLAAWFTDFPGLAELGIIAGAGLLICLTYMYVVFPALLVMIDRRWPPARLDKPAGLRVFDVVRFEGGLGRAPLAVVVLVALSGFAFGQHDFSTDLLELQPVGGSAWRWQSLLLESDDRTRFTIATYSDPDSLQQARRALEKLPEVRATETVLPLRLEEKRAELSPLCERARTMEVGLEGRPDPDGFRRQLFRLRSTFRRYGGTSPEAEEALSGVRTETTELYRALGEMEEERAARRLGSVQSRAARTARDGLEEARSLLCVPPFELARAPGPLRKRYVGSEGTLALFIYPSENTWEGGPRREFVRAVRSVEPAVFGGVVGFHENANTMIQAFVEAAAYSAVVILLLVLLWTRSPRRTLLTLLPLVTGLGFLLLVMRWGPFPRTWNLANFFSVPILMGIGVAGGIHLVRSWRLGDEPFRGALAAVTFSSLTTMIGFGMLSTGAHRGVASLGLIVLLGVTFNLLACLFLLPSALRIFDAGGGSGSSGGGGSGGRGGNGGNDGSGGSGVSGAASGSGGITGAAARATLFSIVMAVGLTATPSALAAQSGRESGDGSAAFLMVKPGDPAATPSQAAEFLSDLGRYLGREVERFDGPLEGHIANTVEGGAELLASEEPVLVFAPAGFHLGHLRGDRAAEVVAQTPRFGTGEERYYVVTASHGPASLEELRGRRIATAFDVDRTYLRRVVFPDDLRPGGGLELAPAENLSDAVFYLMEGDEEAAPAILLDEELKRFFEDDELVWPELKVVWTSDPLPRELVVALGPWTESQIADLRKALFRMESESLGQELLQLMDSSGFEPVDEALLDRARTRYDEEG